MFQVLSADMQRVAARAPASFAPQVKDAQKRLGLLFDHLNNGDLVSQDTIGKLEQLANALEARSYDVAQRLQVEIQRDKVEECGQWMVSSPSFARTSSCLGGVSSLVLFRKGLVCSLV